MTGSNLNVGLFSFPQLSWNWSVACLCCLHVCLLLEAGRMGHGWWTQNHREWSRKGMAGLPAHSLLLRTGNLTTYTVPCLCSLLSLGSCWGRSGEGMVLHFDLEEAARMPTPISYWEKQVRRLHSPGGTTWPDQEVTILWQLPGWTEISLLMQLARTLVSDTISYDFLKNS